MIPKPLRDQVGIRPGPVDVVADGNAIRIEAVADAEMGQERGRVVIPPAGVPIDDRTVDALRHGDQR